MKKLFITLSFIAICINLNGQDCPCCGPEYSHFDFWIGQWEVYNYAGEKQGENTIMKIEGNCAFTETWKSVKENTGTSLNYYDKTDQTWNQTWVDNTGYVLKLKGKMVDGSMVLKSDLLKGMEDRLYYNQITWTPHDDGSVTQIWEIFDENNVLLNTAFKGIYKSKI